MIFIRAEVWCFVGIFAVVEFGVAHAQTQELQGSPPPWTTVIRNGFMNWMENIFGPSDRIAGGSKVSSKSERPYMAFVALQPIDKYRDIVKLALCSGTILTETKVLTGATCFLFFQTFGTDLMSVYAGVKKVFWKKATLGQNSKISSVENHPDYSFTSNPILHDLAIVTLKTSLSFSSKVNKISLPSTIVAANATSYYGQDLTSVGYGFEQNVDITGFATNPVNAILKELLQPLLKQRLKTVIQSVSKNDDACLSYVTGGLSSLLSIFGSAGDAIKNAGIEVFQQLICVTGKTSGSGTCLFDNGGPMINSDGIQVGVMSVVLACDASIGVSIGNELSGSNLVWVKSKI